MNEIQTKKKKKKKFENVKCFVHHVRTFVLENQSAAINDGTRQIKN